MHESAYAFLTSAILAEDVQGRRVVEVGSLDVNGSIRPHVQALRPTSYVGVDMQAGQRVDRVVRAEDLPAVFGVDSFDVVISAEMLEHAADWQGAVKGMLDVLRPGGVLVVTTRGPGFPYHPHPEDYWRYPTDEFGRILKLAGLDVLRLESDHPSSPGVLAKARKPVGWVWPGGEPAQLWTDVRVAPVSA